MDELKKTILSGLKSYGLESIATWLDTTDFFEAPASSHYHGVYEGGLVKHSYEVYRMLNKFAEKGFVDWEEPRSPFIIGILHDVCKIGNYEKYINEEGIVQYRIRKDYIENHYYDEHGSLSVKLLEEHGLKLTSEERLCILYHMGTWTKDIDESLGDLSYTQIVTKQPSVLWTHTADMYVSQVLKI